MSKDEVGDCRQRVWILKIANSNRVYFAKMLGLRTSGREFAEHRGLEDTEKIDNDPLYSISAERIIRLLQRNPSIMALLVGPFSVTILIRDV